MALLPLFQMGHLEQHQQRQLSGTVTYSCNTGYQRSGSTTVTCQAGGSWSTRPSCGGEQCSAFMSIIMPRVHVDVHAIKRGIL